MDQDKRERRILKREIKRAGHKYRRQRVKRLLSECPEEAPFVEDDFGPFRSVEWNGMDRDATRIRPSRPLGNNAIDSRN